MATQTETANVKQQGQQSSSQSAQAGNARQSGNRTIESDSDRQRGLERARENQPQTGVVRGGASKWSASPGRLGQTPFTLMRRMMDDMDRMFEDFGLGRRLASPLFEDLGTDLWGDGGSALWSPAVEVLEKGNNLVVRAEIPGVSKDDVTVSLTNEALTIQGERRRESEDRGDGYYRSERSYGRFFRAIPLPEGIDPEKVDASFKDGVLEVTVAVPKSEQKRGRKIAIR